MMKLAEAALALHETWKRERYALRVRRSNLYRMSYVVLYNYSSYARRELVYDGITTE